MIRVEIIRDNKGNIVSFGASGHAQSAPHGQDIVCAAVSAILQTAVFGLINYLNLEPEIDKNDGWLSCSLDSEVAQKEEVKAILETMWEGLKETEKSYSEYITLKAVNKE